MNKEFEHRFVLFLSESGYSKKKISNILKLLSYVILEIKNKDIDLDQVNRLKLRNQMAEAGVEVTPAEVNDIFSVMKSIKDLIETNEL